MAVKNLTSLSDIELALEKQHYKKLYIVFFSMSILMVVLTLYSIFKSDFGIYSFLPFILLPTVLSLRAKHKKISEEINIRQNR